MPEPNIQQDVEGIIHRTLIHAVDTLAAAHGCEVTHSGRQSPSPQDADTKWLLSRIGFRALGIRGTMNLATTSANANALWPLHLQQARPTGEDLVGEFANCLLGSLQTQLCRVGIKLKMSVPQTQRGASAELLCFQSELGWNEFRFRTANVFVSLNLDVSQAFQWQPLDSNAEPPLNEGECIVF